MRRWWDGEAKRRAEEVPRKEGSRRGRDGRRDKPPGDEPGCPLPKKRVIYRSPRGCHQSGTRVDRPLSLPTPPYLVRSGLRVVRLRSSLFTSICSAPARRWERRIMLFAPFPGPSNVVKTPYLRRSELDGEVPTLALSRPLPVSAGSRRISCPVQDLPREIEIGSLSAIGCQRRVA